MSRSLLIVLGVVVIGLSGCHPSCPPAQIDRRAGAWGGDDPYAQANIESVSVECVPLTRLGVTTYLQFTVRVTWDVIDTVRFRRWAVPSPEIRVEAVTASGTVLAEGTVMPDPIAHAPPSHMSVPSGTLVRPYSAIVEGKPLSESDANVI